LACIFGKQENGLNPPNKISVQLPLTTIERIKLPFVSLVILLDEHTALTTVEYLKTLAIY
jgi:hypothetical protein